MKNQQQNPQLRNAIAVLEEDSGIVKTVLAMARRKNVEREREVRAAAWKDTIHAVADLLDRSDGEYKSTVEGILTKSPGDILRAAQSEVSKRRKLSEELRQEERQRWRNGHPYGNPI